MLDDSQIATEEAQIHEEAQSEAKRWKWIIIGIGLVAVSGVVLLVGAASYAMLKGQEERDQTCEALVNFVKNARRLSTSPDSPNHLTRPPSQIVAINHFYNELLDGLNCYKKEEDSVRKS